MKPVFAFLLICVMGLCGCGQKSYNKREFVFDIHPPEVVQTQNSGKSLIVKRFSINPAFASKTLAYRKGRFEYENDFYNVFLIPPADLISQGAGQWLDASGLFNTVNGAGARDGFELNANIVSLYGDFSEKSKPRAVVGITFFLTKGADVVYHKTITEARPLRSLNADGLMAAYNEGLEAIFGQLESGMREAMAGLGTKGQ